MIERISQGHYQITAPDGTAMGRVDGDYAVGFQARTPDGRKLGGFPTVDEAIEALTIDQARPV